MHIKTKSRRVRAIIVSALLTSAMAIGATADTASAAEAPTNGPGISVVVKVDTPMASMRSGIRW